MIIKYITCSDPHEDVSHSDVLRLLRYAPQVEIGMQALPASMSTGKPRNKWFNGLLQLVQNIDMRLNVAVHVNYQWCDEICSGKIPGEIQQWMGMRRAFERTPVIKRWQLNIGDNTKNWDTRAVAKLISDHPEHEFIFPYNDTVRNKIDELNKTGVPFSLLYDSSYGYGKLPEQWNPPVYDNHMMGYAGGLSPENIAENLDKIAQQVPENYRMWIDAEGRLMRPGTREFDPQRALTYIKNTLAWNKQHIK